MMYPLKESPPEFILQNEDSVQQSEALTGPLFSTCGSTSQEEPGLYNPPEPVPLTSLEISTEETIYSFLTHRRQVSVSPSPLVFAEPYRRLVDCDQQDQQSRQYLLLSPTNPEPVQIQNTPRMNLTPAVLSSPLNLSLSPTWVQSEPGLILAPLSPPNLSKTSFFLISPQPMFVLSPSVPVSSPVEFRSGGVVLLSPFVIRPEGQPSWCSCPVPPRPIQSPALTSSKTTIKVMNVNMTPPSKTNQRPAKTQAERRPVFTPNKDETQGNRTEQKIKDFSDSSGRQTALRNKLNFEACEDCLDVLMSLCSEVKENVDEDDSKTKGTLETENSSFQEYLDKLCSDQHFTQNVGSTLDVDYLTSVSLSDLEDPKQQLVTEDSDLLPVQTDPVTDETLQYLNSDPPHRKLEAEGRDSVEKSVCFSSPLLASHLLEEPAGSTVDNLSPSHEDNQSYAAACRTICPYCCFLLDDVSLSPSNPFKDNVPVSPPEKQTVKPPGLQGSPCDGVPSVPKTGEGRSDTQKRHTKKLQTEDKFVETVQAEERDTECETEPRFCVPGSSGLKDIYMEGKPEDKNPNSRETDESTPRRDPADLRKHRQFSGRRRLFKREENKTSTAEPEPSKTPQDLKEDQQEFKVPHEKPPSSCRETIEDKKHSSRKDESENVNAGMPRPKNTTDGRKTTQASPRRKPETSSENQLQSPSYSSPRKRRSETKDERGEKKKVTEKASTVPKVKTSRSRFVFSQTDRETRDRVAQRDSRQTPLKEKPEPRRPTEGPKSNAAKTHEKRPKSDKMSRQIQKDPGNLKPKAELEEEELQNDLVAPLKKHKQQHDINEIIQPVEYKLMGVKLHLTKCTDDERTTPRRKAKKKPSTG